MEVEKLINKRDLVMHRVKQLSDFALATKADPTKVAQFRIRYQSLANSVSLFEDLHLEIVSLITEQDSLTLQWQLQTDFDDLQYGIKSIYSELGLDVGNEFVISSDDAGSVKSTASSRADSQTGNRHNVRLPRIDIPKFDGVISQWPRFFDLFRTLIHENDSLSNIERFQYLIASLTKEPALIVQNLPITSENYSIAYDSLISRYQNKRILFTNYWLALHNAPKLTSDSSSDLRNLLSIFSENVSALDQGGEVDLWDFTKLNFLLQKLDSSVRKQFEIQFCGNEMPTYSNLKEFLERQCKALETSALSTRPLEEKKVFTHPKQKLTVSKLHSKQASSLVTSVNSSDRLLICVCCKKEHSVMKCDVFLQMSPKERHAFVKKSNLCYNCLSNSHILSRCNSKSDCRVCHKKHHTYLHFPTSVTDSNLDSQTSEPLGDRPDTSVGQVVLTSTLPCFPVVLFATCKVVVRDAHGVYHPCRGLLDCASQANFVTQHLVNKLTLSKSQASVPVQGIGQMETVSTSGIASFSLRPRDKPNPSFDIDAIIVPKICGKTPSSSVDSFVSNHIKNLPLADDTFGHPGEVDILLGAEIYAMALLPGLIKGKDCRPCALNTVFGWIIMGGIPERSSPAVNSFCTSVDVSLNNTLKQFWELEQVPQSTPANPEDTLCEKIFEETHSRDSSGRYIVRLPFRDETPCLGESYSGALRRFHSLENRLEKHPDTREQYAAVMQNYLDCGYMSPVGDKLLNSSSGYYIPHHCVMKPDSTTSKLRVVFDASAQSSNGISLNNTLLVGPKLQNDIGAVLLNFRNHPIALTADIKQMFLQVLVAEEHRDFQRILWRFSSSDPIQECRLNTVTFGVTSSPYLAIRTLLQVAKDLGERYPLAAQVIKSDTYVDDIVSSVPTLAIACETKTQLVNMLGEAGFELRKWASNDSKFIDSFPSDTRQALCFDSGDSTSVKILGLQWCPVIDCFTYKVQPLDRECTKRTILSELARIFDPLGFLSPLTLYAKHLMQLLWQLGIAWDQKPSDEIVQRWKTYKSQLSCLSSLTIPRYTFSEMNASSELHGFCDASEVGYGAVVYLRVVSHSGEIKVSLLYGKSRVSPLKRVSIPRLELCAAVLLAEAVTFVQDTYRDRLQIGSVFCWSDSTVALQWIRSSPHRWKTFVANRVSQIQERVPPDCWHHISGLDNPADCASRGLTPEQLMSHGLWWTGPDFLLTPPETWDHFKSSEEDSEEVFCEQKPLVCITEIDKLPCPLDLLEKFSSLRKIQGTIAYCIRFANLLRAPRENRVSGGLTEAELYHALVVLVKAVQSMVFNKEISDLEVGRPCSKPIRKLSPFLDEDGVLRVGGRLRHADLSFDVKHPMLLPRKHRLTDLVIRSVHQNNLHPGSRTLQYLLSQRFWILSARRAINGVLGQCYRCFRARPTALTPLMGDLPPARVSQLKPFSHAGVDFAGPFLVTQGRYRGVRSVKAYVCIFVCMATKAVHLELVSDLTSEAFLAALRRFTSRRGRCDNIYSDNGTNFVGADRLLTSYAKQATDCLAIRWHWNPPSGAHFGGLWEAGVRSIKTHLRRVVHTQILTFEEMTTVLAQIEAVLNSRPLCSASTDPNDLMALSPGHFLTMEPLGSPPDQAVTSLPLNRLSRWQLVSRIHQDFWKRWKKEYLHTLQQRDKWNTPQQSPAVGSLVVIKNESTSPLVWSLARIVQLYPGADGTPRIAQVRTATGLLERPLTKLCPLPSQ